jgi:aminoglycoside 6'-N-acetyltransferase
VDGEPAGYIQAWFVGHHQNETWIADHPWLEAFPPDAVGVDISLADEARLGRGIGSAAVRAFTLGLVARGHETVIIDPDPDNRRAVRAYARAGFRPVPALEGRTGDTLIMQFDLNETRQ